jgi:hypothetical protein
MVLIASIAGVGGCALLSGLACMCYNARHRKADKATPPAPGNAQGSTGKNQGQLPVPSAPPAAAVFGSQLSRQTSRFDGSNAQVDFIPIRGWERATPLGLLDSVKHLPIQDIVLYAKDALQYAHDYLHRKGVDRGAQRVDPLGLNMDQIAALNLYTLNNDSNADQSFYRVLNKTCNSRNRKELSPFLSYLRLFFEAARTLPNAGPIMLFRGFPNQQANWQTSYNRGKRIYWWAPSSCTKSARVLQNDAFFGPTGPRTMFVLECLHGIDISSYSCYPEEEVLLLPGTQFEVEQTIDPALMNGILQIFLKQLPVHHGVLAATRAQTPPRARPAPRRDPPQLPGPPQLAP